jgi:hypothetical protein
LIHKKIKSFPSFSYPSTYINKQFQEFFADYLSSSWSSSLLPFINDEDNFLLLRQKILAQPTTKQAEVAISAASVDITRNQQNGVMETSIKRNKDKFQKNLFVHYTYEKRLKGLAREIHAIHDSLFQNTIHGTVRLIVGNRNNPNIVYELARKRPSSSLIKDPLKKSRIYLIFVES